MGSYHNDALSPYYTTLSTNLSHSCPSVSLGLFPQSIEEFEGLSIKVVPNDDCPGGHVRGIDHSDDVVHFSVNGRTDFGGYFSKSEKSFDRNLGLVVGQGRDRVKVRKRLRTLETSRVVKLSRVHTSQVHVDGRRVFWKEGLMRSA